MVPQQQTPFSLLFGAPSFFPVRHLKDSFVWDLGKKKKRGGGQGARFSQKVVKTELKSASVAKGELGGLPPSAGLGSPRNPSGGREHPGSRSGSSSAIQRAHDAVGEETCRAKGSPA